MDLTQYKENPKTQYLAQEYERLLREQSELVQMSEDPTMKELAEADLSNLKTQMDAIQSQME